MAPAVCVVDDLDWRDRRREERNEPWHLPEREMTMIRKAEKKDLVRI